MRKDHHRLRDRVQIWGDILSRPWRWAVATPFALLATFQSIRDEFLPEPLAKELKLPNWLPHWDWKTWALITLALLLIGVLEGAYQVIKVRRDPEWRNLVANALQKGDDLSSETLPDAAAVTEWQMRADEWASGTASMLAAHCGEPDRQLFSSIPPFKLQFIGGSVNRAHSDGRQVLEMRMEVLREILRRPLPVAGS